MATKEQIDVLARLLGQNIPEEQQPFSRMDEDQLADLRNLEVSTPENPEEGLTDEEFAVSQANRMVEADNAINNPADRQLGALAAEGREPAGGVDELDQPQEPAAASDPREQMLKRYQELIDKYSERVNRPQEKPGIMEALPDILAGAYNIIGTARGEPIRPMAIDTMAKRQQQQRALRSEDEQRLANLMQNYMQLAKPADQITPYQREVLGLKKEELELKKKKQEEAPEPTFEEKEKIKADIKQKLEDKKFKRKELEQTKESIKNVESQLEDVRRAKRLLADLVKKGKIADTGPIDQYITAWTDEGQKLRQAFNNLSLEKMTKMFQGMSKAIDSDAERRMFEQSQASLGNYPSVNLEILNNMERALQSTKQKNIEYLRNDLAKTGPDIKDEAGPYGEEVERNGKVYKWNSNAKAYRLKE